MSVTLVDARRMILACYRHNEPLMLLGEPGMGKTSLFDSVCKDEKLGHIDFRLSMRDQVEVGGMRIPDQKTGLLRHFVPEDLPNTERHGDEGIIVFDEINVVAMAMQAAAYGIIQERRTGNYVMPDGWVPMAAGNNTTDGAAAQRMSTALANRFNIQFVKPDLDAWLELYGSKHVDIRGTMFLRFRPTLFHRMPKSRDEVIFPTARSWTKAFKFIDEEPRLRQKLMGGCVGEEAAREFAAYVEIMEKAATFDEIVANPMKARVPEERDAGTYYAVTGMVGRLVTRKTVKPVSIYVERLLPDYQSAFWRDATNREPGLKQTEAYAKWAVEHQDVTL